MVYLCAWFVLFVCGVLMFFCFALLLHGVSASGLSCGVVTVRWF